MTTTMCMKHLRNSTVTEGGLASKASLLLAQFSYENLGEAPSLQKAQIQTIFL